jgi:hypothetical protein
MPYTRLFSVKQVALAYRAAGRSVVPCARHASAGGACMCEISSSDHLPQGRQG